ncbi:MAG: alpha/beta hydrolase [Planctomycetaceae bacterium]
MNWVVVLACVSPLFVLDLLFQIVVLRVGLPIFESRPPFRAERHPPDRSAEPISIATSYGLRLQGSLFRTFHAAPRGLVLFCHELDSDRWSAALYCEGLLAAGFHVLAFNFRNHGDSDQMPGYEPMHWLTGFEVDDVRAAVAYIDSRVDLRTLPLGVFGISRGGCAALVAAAGCDSVLAVCTDGAYSCDEMLRHFTARWGCLYFPETVLRLLPRWHVRLSLWLIRSTSQLRRGCRYANIEKAMTALRRKPVLMMSGERDTYVIPAVTLNLHARTAQDEPGVWIVPGAKHNMARQTAGDEYDRRIVEFFTMSLGQHRQRQPRERGRFSAAADSAARLLRSSGAAPE